MTLRTLAGCSAVDTLPRCRIPPLPIPLASAAGLATVLRHKRQKGSNAKAGSGESAITSMWATRYRARLNIAIACYVLRDAATYTPFARTILAGAALARSITLRPHAARATSLRDNVPVTPRLPTAHAFCRRLTASILTGRTASMLSPVC